MNRYLYFSLAFLFISTQVFSQKQTLQILINPMFGKIPLLVSDSAFSLKSNDNLKINVLKFYISHIRLLNKGQIVLEDENNFHLIDASSPSSLNIKIIINKNIDFDVLTFEIGVDSVNSVSGAMGEDLDPTNGMYWAWQSGYINFKLEGISAICNSRNHEFQFHIGGYSGAFNCLKKLSFPCEKSNHVNIDFDIKNILNNIDLQKQHHIMSPGKEAIILSEIIGRSFSIVK